MPWLMDKLIAGTLPSEYRIGVNDNELGGARGDADSSFNKFECARGVAMGSFSTLPSMEASCIRVFHATPGLHHGKSQKTKKVAGRYS